MVGQFAPLDFRRIMATDFAHPAFVRGDIWRPLARRILVGAVHVNDGVADQRAGVAEDGCSGNGRSLLPFVLLGVVYLDIFYGVRVRPAADQVDITVAIDAGD